MIFVEFCIIHVHILHSFQISSVIYIISLNRTKHDYQCRLYHVYILLTILLLSKRWLEGNFHSILILIQFITGVNLRTGRLGIFPSAYAVDSDLSDWDPSCEHGHRERYQLGYVGSVETLAHKGTSVVCQAVKKVTANGQELRPTSCILEVSDQGLRMVDRSKKNVILLTES